MTEPTPAARRASLPGGPATVPKPSIAIATLTCPGGTGAEPGAEFTVSGTLDSYLVYDTWVTVSCDGLVYPAAVTADGSSFTAQVRAYWPGPFLEPFAALGHRDPNSLELLR